MFGLEFSVKDVFSRLYQKINDDDILGNAAQVAFYFTFALFPLLLFLLSLFGVILQEDHQMRGELFQYLRQVMPGSAYELVRTTLEEVTTNATGGKLTLGVVITLWSASVGIDNVRGALNEVYNLEETRSWLRTRFMAVLLTLGIGLLVFIALAMIFYGSQLLSYLLPFDSPAILALFQWAMVLVTLGLTFAVVYNFSPNHRPFKWKWITPGAVFAIVLWLLFSGVFRLYLRYFDTYAATYGSLGAVIILLLWLYITALVILIGGAVNAIFDEIAGIQKSASDPEQIRNEKEQSGKQSRTH